MTSERLELRDLVKRFGGVTALDGASFSARAGASLLDSLTHAKRQP